MLRVKTVSNYDAAAALLSLAYFGISLLLCFIKWGDFGYTSLDLGIFTQSLSSAVHGRLFYNTVEWQLYGAPSHFGVHFQPVMFLLSLPFRLFPSPKTLLVLQSLFLGVSVYLAYLFAKGPLGEGRALALAGLYAINSSLIGINLFEFHPVSLAVPLFLLAALFLERGNRRAFYLTSALILSVKEDAFLGVAALSLWWALRDGTGPERLRASKDLILVALISMVYGVLAIKLIIPHFGGAYLYSGLYSHPSIGREELLYFLIFNLSFGLLPLFRASNAILLAPPWMESLLPHRWSQFTIGFHYPYMLVPLSFIGAVESLKELDWRRAAVPLLAVGLLTSAVTMPVTETPPKGMNPLIHCSVLRPIPAVAPRGMSLMPLGGRTCRFTPSQLSIRLWRSKQTFTSIRWGLRRIWCWWTSKRITGGSTFRGSGGG